MEQNIVTEGSYIKLDARLMDCAIAKGVKSLQAITAYCLIYGHTASSPNGCFFGTLETVQYWTRASSRTSVIKYLTELVDAGLVEKIMVMYKGKNRPAYRARSVQNLDVQNLDVQNLDMSKIWTQSVQNLDTMCSEFGHNKLIDKLKIKGNNNARAREAKPNFIEELDAGLRLAEAALQPIDAEKPSGAPTAALYPQNVQEVAAYLKSLPSCPSGPIVDEIASKFFDSHEAAGWIDGKQRPIRNWKASARLYLTSWLNNESERRYQQQSKQYSKPEPTKPKKDDYYERKKQERIDAANARPYDELKKEIIGFVDDLVSTHGTEAGIAKSWHDDLRRSTEREQQIWREYIAEKYGITDFKE